MTNLKNEQKIYTAVCLDFETGGLYCQENACTELALHAIRLDTLETIDRYKAYFRPYYQEEGERKVLRRKKELIDGPQKMMVYEPKALSYSNISMEQLEKEGVPLKEIAQETLKFAERNTLTKGKQMKPFLLGQNVVFDVGFFQQVFAFAGLTKEFSEAFAGHYDYYGNFQPLYLDTILLGRLAAAHDPTAGYRLEQLAERFGITLNDAHDAHADVTATSDIMKVCACRLRNSSGSSGNVISVEEKTRKHFLL